MLDGYFDFAGAGVDVFYNSGQVVLTVVRSESGSPAPQAATVDYATNDNTAIAGVDYGATSGTLSFGPNDTSKTITIPILGVPEIPSVDFGVELSNPQSTEPVNLGSTSAAAVSIVDADVTLTNPGDQTNYQGDTVNIPFTATDAAGYPPTFTATNLPSGLSIDPNSGTISGVIPGDAATGTNAISVTATDPQYLTSATQSFNLTVNPINHAPVGTDNTVTTLENQPYVFTTADFGFSDPNDTPANNLKAVEITSLPGAGTLSESGFVSVADINAGDLIFTPANDDNGTPYTSFQFQVQDDGGTDHGGVDTDPSPKTMTINVTWVNQQPSFSASDPPALDTIGADPVSISNWATFNPGASNESWQTPTYIVTNVSNLSLFDTLPSISADGTLTYTTSEYSYGTSTFDVKVQDDGGTANGGVDTSAVATFTVAVADAYQVRYGTNSGRGSLRDGIIAGNQQTANLPITFNGVSTVNLTSELPLLSGNFTIGSQANPATVQGNGNFRIFTISALATVNMDYLSITNGSATNTSPSGINGNGNGGGILTFGNLQMLSVTFYGNQAPGYGGALAVYGGTVTANACSFYSNQATVGGGAIYVAYNSAASFADCDIASNSAGNGGGIFGDQNANVTAGMGTQVYANAANGGGSGTSGRGGGIYMASGGTLNMTYGLLGYNTASDEGGGLFSRATSTLYGILVINNFAEGKGGGIYVRSGNVTLQGECTVSGNSSDVPLTDPTQASGIIWADPGTITANRSINDIQDGIDYDGFP